MHLLPVRIQRVPSQGHPVLPAVQAADPQRPDPVRAQPVAVAATPHRPLGVRGIQLPVRAHEAALRIDRDQRAVDRPPPRPGPALRHSQEDEHAQVARRLRDPPQLRPVELHRRLQIRAIGAGVLGITEAAGTAQHHPERVATQKGLREYDQLDPLPRRPLQQLDNLCRGRRRIQPHRRRLRRRYPHSHTPVLDRLPTD